MTSWLSQNFEEKVSHAKALANEILLSSELFGTELESNYDGIEQAAFALELSVLDLLQEDLAGNEDQLNKLRTNAADAFKILRVVPTEGDAIQAGETRLRICLLAVLGDITSDAARWLRESPWETLPLESSNWHERTKANVLDIWLRLIRKKGWEDRDAVLAEIASLRSAQHEFEENYFEENPENAKTAAWELIVYYHLAKAAEILALYITDGEVEGNYQIHQLLDTHFDRALEACQQAPMYTLEPLARYLARAAWQLAENSIWTVSRAVNSRVTQFVRTLVDRGRGDKAIFDVLPPQRRALAEEGLLGSSRRAVVVSLPTSSGKTLIAQFRILQALNQFDHEKGWVVYLAPTRTLVNQIARNLRRDFEPLGVMVERVSPALEVDGIEAGLLSEQDEDDQFRVLVTTPEKLDLMLRQGWESKINRPLTLVVVDEAHNIQGSNRGLKLELLLATINKECRYAQFLLLTPFISNAREVAQWLGDANSQDISLALDWQPNDRVIGIVQPSRGEQLNGRSYDYQLEFETVHTTRNTIFQSEKLVLPKVIENDFTFSQITDQSNISIATAHALKQRGPVIVMHSRPDWVESLADKLKASCAETEAVSENIKLVQSFLTYEFGEEFSLISLLNHGIAVHHSGLSDEARTLVEWLFENEELDYLVATTTIAQGVNFPVSGVVMASHQYPYGIDMPPEDFWNIAGRAGRVNQGSLGVVALAAKDNNKTSALKAFINEQAGELNSALIQLVLSAEDLMEDLSSIVYKRPEWSTFLQYLSHTYRQMENPDNFATEVEQVLRGTFGFDTLRTHHSDWAQKLIAGVEHYSTSLSGQPLKLVDSTGFSLQSVKSILAASREQGINADSWDVNTLFSERSHDLHQMMGVLLKVPELRESFEMVIGGNGPDGNSLSAIIKSWVNGQPISEIAREHFMRDGDFDKALMNCGKSLFGRLVQTTSWGLGAMLTITANELPDDEFLELANLPGYVFYGVNSNDAMALRLLGVPRNAAIEMASVVNADQGKPFPQIRRELRALPSGEWQAQLGERRGRTYETIWRILEGIT